MTPPILQTSAHVKYIQTLDTHSDRLDYHLTTHLRLSGVYWGLTALHLLRHPTALPRPATIAFVLSCQHPSGGFGASPAHDPHLLYTLSAIQILATVDALDALDADKTVRYIAARQTPDGCFTGDEWGEKDTRFIYCALNALSLLRRLDAVDVDAAMAYVMRCRNPDGGFGMAPQAESHAGQIFTCLGALRIGGALERLMSQDQINVLGDWLCERQLPSGGLNGRPEKLEDVCYSWWVVSSLAMVGRVGWVDGGRLEAFILGCQDVEGGGFADRAGDVADVFHTVFGVAGLSLLGYEGLEEVDPVYCMPREVTRRVLGK
ncbi:uncharacterized protein LAJ45_01256 [Morchella importuna]|uniref:uncharacterized protein n=1 Tax=Morchella importuna TaxID=1174673 RepID=UPI001E8DC622|nr:uncharacterized protein LAJ45_01256 [Morchella importuna]KAH8154725.1 hypothetical protein LAJ45_01256 [Morchella importuna]